jgi:hypothetical protein
MSEPPVVVTNPGVVTVASDTIRALQTSPVLLVMVLLNMAFIAAGAWYLRNQQDHAFALVGSLFERCLPMKPPLSGDSHTGVYSPSFAMGAVLSLH